MTMGSRSAIVECVASGPVILSIRIVSPRYEVPIGSTVEICGVLRDKTDKAGLLSEIESVHTLAASGGYGQAYEAKRGGKNTNAGCIKIGSMYEHLSDLVIEDTTAVVFDHDDEMSIVGALTKLLGKRAVARNLAQAGQQYLRENHTVSDMVAATVRAYRRACDRTKSQPR